MSADVITEVYRTQEQRDIYKFKAALTISYFGKEATLQGLSGAITPQCVTELMAYLQAKGVTSVRYFRRGKLITRSIKSDNL